MIERFIEFLIQKISEVKQFANLLINQYGNYFCQKMFLILTHDQKKVLLDQLSEMRPDEKKEELHQLSEDIIANHGSFMSQFFWISTNSKGTHALQVFIENLEESNFKDKIT